MLKLKGLTKWEAGMTLVWLQTSLKKKMNTEKNYIGDITRWHEDTNFIFEWKNNILRKSAASE